MVDWPGLGRAGFAVTIACRPPGEPAFTLAETLVALAVAGMGLAALHAAVESAAVARRAAAEMLRMDVLARSLLAQGEVSEPGLATGETAGFVWRLEIAPGGQAPGVRAVRVEIEAPSGRRRELATLAGRFAAVVGERAETPDDEASPGAPKPPRKLPIDDPLNPPLK